MMKIKSMIAFAVQVAIAKDVFSLDFNSSMWERFALYILGEVHVTKRHTAHA